LRGICCARRRSTTGAPFESQLNDRLGVRGGRDASSPDAVSWQVSDGVLLMPATEPRIDSEAALLWLSAAAMRSRRDGG
jgi:hypothetical protein